MTQPNFLFLTVVAVVFLCRGSLSQNECDSAEHQCWYIKYISVRTTTLRRAWYCLFFCRVEYTEYRVMKQKTCDCCPGWTMQGGQCTQCDTGQYGKNCEEVCSCDDGYQCDQIDGFCEQLIRDDVHRNCDNACVNAQRCNHTTNVCECPPAWSDDSGGECHFLSGCSDGYFGLDCSQPCLCENNATCDVLSGSCDCLAGWSGVTCSDPCGPSNYGRNCNRTCECPNNALECSAVDGGCLCPPGFYGMNCSVECPGGYYGSNCRHNCSCVEQNEMCDPINGTCTAKAGLPTPKLGTDADEPGGLSSSVTGGVIGGVIAVIFICVLIASLLFIRRRRKENRIYEKSIISHEVHYEKSIISHEVQYENAIDVTEEYPELKKRDHQGNAAYAMGFQSPPQRFNVGGATYAIPDKSKPAVTDDVTDPTEEYSHLDRAVVVKPPKPVSDECNDYNALGATAADSDNQYSHLDRGQESRSVGIADDYGDVLQSGEHGGEYSNLGRRGRQNQNHAKLQYEVVGVK